MLWFHTLNVAGVGHLGFGFISYNEKCLDFWERTRKLNFYQRAYFFITWKQIFYASQINRQTIDKPENGYGIKILVLTTVR